MIMNCWRSAAANTASATVSRVSGEVVIIFSANGFIFALPCQLSSRLVLKNAGHTTLTAMPRSEEHTSELQSLMRISYAVFCLKKKKKQKHIHTNQSQRKHNSHY